MTFKEMPFKNPFFTLRTSEINRLADFYSEAFGFKQEYRWPEDPVEPIGFVLLVLDGRELVFALPNDPRHDLPLDAPIEPVSHILCLKTDDVDAKVSRLRASGTPVLYEPTDQPYGERMAYVADPEGRPILLYSDIESDDVSVAPESTMSESTLGDGRG